MSILLHHYYLPITVVDNIVVMAYSINLHIISGISGLKHFAPILIHGSFSLWSWLIIVDLLMGYFSLMLFSPPTIYLVSESNILFFTWFIIEASSVQIWFHLSPNFDFLANNHPFSSLYNCFDDVFYPLQNSSENEIDIVSLEEPPLRGVHWKAPLTLVLLITLIHLLFCGLILIPFI